MSDQEPLPQQHRIQTLSEQRHHFIACQLIVEAAKAMNLSQAIVLTAQSIYHRFYQR